MTNIYDTRHAPEGGKHEGDADRGDGEPEAAHHAGDDQAGPLGRQTTGILGKLCLNSENLVNVCL